MTLFPIACLAAVLVAATPVLTAAAVENAPAAQAEAPQNETGKPGPAPTGGSDLPQERKGPLTVSNRDTFSPRADASTALKLVFFAIIALAALLLTRGIIRKARFLTLDGLKKMRLKKFNSLSPAVLLALEGVGSSLWGGNGLLTAQYRIDIEKDRWVLSDLGRERLFRTIPERNCLEVCLRDTHFKVRIVLLNGNRTNITFDCSTTSVPELKSRLEEARAVIAEHAGSERAEARV